MLVAQAINLASTTTMMTLIVTEQIEAWHAFVAIFVTGTGFTLDFSARRSFYAEIFPVSGLSNAISLGHRGHDGKQPHRPAGRRGAHLSLPATRARTRYWLPCS